MSVQKNGETKAAKAATRAVHTPAKRLRILIIHQNFPGQFRHLAQHLHSRADVEVIGLGRDTAPGLKIDNADFPWFKYKLHRQVKTETHPYLRQMEAAVLHGQAVARALDELKRKGFTPDIILAHPGWGETLYAKEIFPQVKLIHFCEWYYSTSGADFNFDPEFPSNLDDHLRITTWNALHLLNLENCDAAVAPTHWQKSQFPQVYQDKIHVIHEGIDTQNLGPDPHAELTLPLRHSRAGGNPVALEEGNDSGRLTLKPGDPIITYVARNLEPYRGFHTFMRALPKVLNQHPTAQILIIGGDERSYGAMPKDATNWREKMLREVGSELGDNQQRLALPRQSPLRNLQETPANLRRPCVSHISICPVVVVARSHGNGLSHHRLGHRAGKGKSSGITRMACSRISLMQVNWRKKFFMH